MFDYIFSHKILSDEFCTRLEQLSIPHTAQDDDLGFVVSVSEDVDENVVDQLEMFYDTLMEKSEKMLADDSEEHSVHVSAITITLRDGRISHALVRPELMNKIMSALSFEELNELVEAITDSVEHPDSRPVCRR